MNKLASNQEGGSEKPFPQRISREAFPHQPPEGATKLPATKQNVEQLLKQCKVNVSYDVIKKRQSFTRNGEALKFSDLIGLANLNSLNSPWFGDFIQEIAESNPLNPVRDWIESKPWDGTDRLCALYETVTCDEEFHNGLKCLLINHWLRSAVAAAAVDDFRSRGVLTFQGPQGCGKTSWIARLVPSGLTGDFVKLDHHLDPHNKDSVFIAVSHWITEIGELDSSFKKDVARLKGHITNSCDKLRLPYAKSPIEMKRKTVYAASVNDPHFLIDQTGNNRFWTIPVVKLDYRHEIDMQQVFAQLLVEVNNGAEWWLSPAQEKLLEDHNKRFQAVSVIEERLLDALEREKGAPRYMTAMQVLQAIGFNSPTNPQCRECGAILRQRYGPPKRVDGRTRWQVPLKTTEQAWEAFCPQEDEDIY
ncbi:VapE family protein [Altererythrobacter arenosus]|uniref:VapE family protein n=1 Tax=Altererythrobacter arenosus TaxID=3032592 RepID=A0ABY8FM99_9SPHN|nr:VapE domain-containing protein [Altererythrobacter sp. CAU 1644]WFL76149.1 VapE family protein [Altererythrobacter sp. CAU 1644]